MIVGIDEVGRGPWAGPLVVGAVALPDDCSIAGLTDSKKLSKTKRELLDQQIRQQAAGFGLGWVHAEEIDELGLSKSLRVACQRAMVDIKVPYHEIIIDGTVNFLAGTGKGPYVTTMKKADLLIRSVSAAAIIAKVARDAWMTAQDDIYEGYNFTGHVGYGTAQHKAALLKHGITPLHRKSFAPIAALLGQPAAIVASSPSSTRTIGMQSETVAAHELINRGYRVLERNWKTKFCEIDIVALQDDTLYFIEVKHRQTADAGDGLAAITAKKQRQMKFAAEFYKHTHGWKGDMRLLAISTAGAKPTVTSFLALE